MDERLKHDQRWIATLAGFLSLGAALYFLRRGETLLYGDAVAHLNIARRVVDSLTPGPLQLGTVWLPLPHLLTLPLVWWDKAWQSGMAGVAPSMLGYIASCAGIFRLTSLISSRGAAWLAAAIFGLNPNLLYMQSTPMTETIYLAGFIWAVAYAVETCLALRHGDEPQIAKSMSRCAYALCAAMLTRYDGWFLAVLVGGVFFFTSFGMLRNHQLRLRKHLRNFVLLIATVPVLWLAYNFGVFGNAMEFATGQYSARAIAERTRAKGDPPHPGFQDPQTAFLFFQKAAKLNVAEGPAQNILLMLAGLGAFASLFSRYPRSGLLLWTPLVFYTLSIAYGGVPIFMPQWWPHSYYNVRYGLQLLPAIAVFVAVTFVYAQRLPMPALMNRWMLVVPAVVMAWSSVAMVRATPICLQEARVNSVSRLRFENALAIELRRLPPQAKLMMFTGNHVGALQSAGIPLRRVLHEGNHPEWDNGLLSPAASADYIVAIEGDAVDAAVKRNPMRLGIAARVQTEGKPPAVIYRSAFR